MSMITTATWVPRGVAAPFPKRYEITEAEIDRISKLARLQLEDAKEALETAKNGMNDDTDSDREQARQNKQPNGSSTGVAQNDDDLKEYDLDDYDNDQVDEEGESITRFGNVQSLAYHAPDEKDPYLDLPTGEVSDEEEREELQILATDNLLLAGKVEDEVAHLEVYIYEDEADNLYVHHDIMLPAIPLCTEWIDLAVGKDTGGQRNGNFVAIGTMEPEIELWDLDVVDSMYPTAILGQAAQPQENGAKAKGAKKQKKQRERDKKVNDNFHVDAVLALAVNRQHRNLLASGSADETVKLWDLGTGNCAKSYSMHRGKVCALNWHPSESNVLLSGSYDHTVIATDMRAPEAKAPQWSVGSDVENVRWNPHDPNCFFVTTDAGLVLYHDARATTAPGPSSKPLWTLQAHDAAVSSFDVNPTISGFIVTGSDDKIVKLWNVEDNRPSVVTSRNLGVGRVFATRFAPDTEVGFRLAIAGSKGSIQVWDTSTNSAVRRAFANKAAMPDQEVNEKLIRVREESSGSESDEEEEDGAPIPQNGWESMDED